MVKRLRISSGRELGNRREHADTYRNADNLLFVLSGSLYRYVQVQKISRVVCLLFVCNYNFVFTLLYFNLKSIKIVKKMELLRYLIDSDVIHLHFREKSVHAFFVACLFVGVEEKA